jgi:hypothetical protein
MNGKVAIALLGIAAFLPLSVAQIRGTAIRATTIRGTAIRIPVSNRPSSSGAMGHSHRSPLVLANPYLYADYPSSSDGFAEAPQPQVVVVQMPATAEAAPKEPSHEPLLIEWKDDRYVRIGVKDGAAERSAPAPLDYIGSSVAKPSANQAEVSPSVLPPIVLVYRDGRQEELRDYTIADGIIYARGDYWTDGYWNKRIQLAVLNLPATIKASLDRGAKFVLPGSANEVITRP